MFGMLMYGATSHGYSPARDGRERVASCSPNREPIVVRIDTKCEDDDVQRPVDRWRRAILEDRMDMSWMVESPDRNDVICERRREKP